MVSSYHGEKTRRACKAPPRAAAEAGRPDPQVEVQRAYRARLAAAGKVVRIVDANAVPVPGFDPAKDGVFERDMIASLREQLRIALSKMELREEEVQTSGGQLDPAQPLL